MQILRNGGKAGKEQHHVEAQNLPDADQRHGGNEEDGIGKEGDGFETQPFDRGIHRAERRVQQELPHGRHGDEGCGDGKKIGDFPEGTAALAIIDEQGHAKRQKHAEGDDDDRVDGGIRQRTQENRVLKCFYEVAEADEARGERAELVIRDGKPGENQHRNNIDG